MEEEKVNKVHMRTVLIRENSKNFSILKVTQ